MSTTERVNTRGQVLVLFALSSVVLMLVAALAFDTGAMLLERRTEQNAADAAALAGARYLPDNPTQARVAATRVAAANGYVHGAGPATVTISIPPVSGANVGRSGYIQVQIASNQPSIFGGILGVAGWPVGAGAVAANVSGVSAPFAMLSLDPSGCKALDVEGKGEIVSNGNIQVNSSCTPNAFNLAGQGEIITAPNVLCNVSGEYYEGGGASNNCPVREGQVPIDDPFRDLAAPSIPTTGDPPVVAYPTPPAQEGGATLDIPEGCPGHLTLAATHDVPRTCGFPGAYSGTTWRLYPGYYPGGINLEAGTFYMEPGIFWIGGGGFRIAGGGASVTSVAKGGTTLGGGILIYNSTNPDMAAGQVILQGGDAGVNLWPLDDGSEWDGMVIFQDRTVTLTVEIVGASSTMQVRGLIYVPAGTVLVQANGGDMTVDQVIAYRFRMAGNEGTLTVSYDTDFLPTGSLAGLIE